MARRTFTTLLAASSLGAGLVATSIGAPVAAANGGDPVLAEAVAFLAESQQEDGGFDLGGFAGFETLDAVLAVGLGAGPGPLVPAEGVARVEAVTTGGLDGFDAIDDELDAAAEGDGLAPGRAAKIAVLTALPFGFDLEAFDPAGDGAPVDLVAAIEAAGEPGATLAFTDTLYVILALAGDDRPVSPEAVQAVRDAQQANGGWDFAGDPAGAEVDVDLTSLAIQALVAAGADAGDPAVAGGLRLLATEELPGGGWETEGSGLNPNSTALAVLALTTAGFDVDDRCWRDLAAPGTAAATYTSPVAALRSLQAEDGRIASPFDDFGINTFATSQAVQALSRAWLPATPAPAPDCDAPAYTTVDAAGAAIRFTEAGRFRTSAGAALTAPVVGAAELPGGTGSWLFAADGGVFTTGDAGFAGSAGSLALNQPIVGGAAAPDGAGYWLVAADGGVFSYGSARFHGSMGGRPLNQPVVGMAAAADGRGYHLVAADGGVFSFGSARFAGSTGALTLNQPVVGMAADPDGDGYWLVAADGGVFAYRADFGGSLGALRLARPIVGMAVDPDGPGYRLVAADGGVFALGGAPFFGSAVGAAGAGTVAITAG